MPRICTRIERPLKPITRKNLPHGDSPINHTLAEREKPEPRGELCPKDNKT